MEKYILLYDSGLGGQYVLDCFRSAAPNERYILYADTKNAPFGSKNKAKLKRVLFDALFQATQKYPIKRIVIACNTMSSMFKKDIKKVYPNTIFVEPMLNARILRKPTLVLATPNTIKYSPILAKYRSHPNYRELALPDLAYLIDTCGGNFATLLPYIKKHLERFQDVQNIVLGCTHYNWVKPQIEQCFSRPITFYEKSKTLAQNKKSPQERGKYCGGLNRTRTYDLFDVNEAL